MKIIIQFLHHLKASYSKDFFPFFNNNPNTLISLILYAIFQVLLTSIISKYLLIKILILQLKL